MERPVRALEQGSGTALSNELKVQYGTEPEGGSRVVRAGQIRG
jgi:hypothetical protein